jgi:hypothetical protein
MIEYITNKWGGWAMTIFDAIKEACALVLDKTGVECEPDMVRRVTRNGSESWWIVFNNSHFFAEEVSQGDVIDGGECTVCSDCNTGALEIVG